MSKINSYLRLNKLLVSVCVLVSLLASCATPEKPSPVTPTPPPAEDGDTGSSPERTLTGWTLNPDFSISTLNDPETEAWYRRVGLEVEAEKTETCLPKGTSPEDYPYYPSSPTVAACSATKHYVGRSLNFYVTSLLTLFRVTGDAALLEEVDRVMEIARNRLADTDGDGFRNFRRIAIYGPDDFNPKEDSLAHGFIAEVVYVFRRNAAASTSAHDYAAHADAWFGYLRNDFEAKWALQRKTRDTEGLPQRDLMHPWMEMLRYTVYMAKLVPEDARYVRLRDAMAAAALSDFKTDVTPKGDAFVWSHVVRQTLPDPNACTAFQMGTYPQQTMNVFMDLALEGYGEFSSDEAVLKMSRTLSESLLNPNEKAFMYKDVGGLRNGSLNTANPKTTIIGGACFNEASSGNSGSDPEGNFRDEGSYIKLAWGFWATFAPDGETPLESTEIYKVNRDVYGDPAVVSTPSSAVHIPAAMAFARLYRAGNYTLQQP